MIVFTHFSDYKPAHGHSRLTDMTESDSKQKAHRTTGFNSGFDQIPATAPKTNNRSDPLLPMKSLSLSTTSTQTSNNQAASEHFRMCNAEKKIGCPAAGFKMNAPRRINVEVKVLVEVEYQKDFWGSVDFNPVPPFFINTHDPINQDVYISGSVHQRTGPWDPYIWNLFVNILSKSEYEKLVVDVGANLGYFSLLAASMGFKVVSFEPMNRNAAKFLSSIARNNFEDKIILYQNAVTYNSCDSVTMTETHNTNQGNGQIKGSTSSKEGLYGQDYVDTIKIDDVIHTDVLLMKIDVEGFEGAVLNGAKNLICWNLVLYITIEFSHDTRHSKDCPALQMLQLLESVGYSISDIVADAPNLSPANFGDFPPNILFKFSNTSSPPGYRLGPNSACS